MPAVCVLDENKKKIKIFQHNIVIFAAEKKSQYIAWACFRNDDFLSKV